MRKPLRLRFVVGEKCVGFVESRFTKEEWDHFEYFEEKFNELLSSAPPDKNLRIQWSDVEGFTFPDLKAWDEFIRKRRWFLSKSDDVSFGRVLAAFENKFQGHEPTRQFLEGLRRRSEGEGIPFWISANNTKLFDPVVAKRLINSSLSLHALRELEEWRKDVVGSLPEELVWQSALIYLVNTCLPLQEFTYLVRQAGRWEEWPLHPPRTVQFVFRDPTTPKVDEESPDIEPG